MNEQNSYQWKVCVRCMTYNQSNYITDAMKGFTMQQTVFPYVCCIVDDCSTDGEQEVIKQYLHDNFDLEDKSVVRNEETDYYVLTFARHKTNKNCYFAVLYLKYNHYNIKKTIMPYISEWNDNAQYLAICEGDDYWSLSNKLQTQVTFLDSHMDYYVCSHDYIRYYENEKMFAKNSFYNNLFSRTSSNILYIDYSLDNYFKRWFTQPLTCVYRNGKYLSEIPRKEYKYFRDDIFFYYVLKRGKGALFRDIMGVYRINDSGVWSTKDPIQKKRDSIYNAYNILNVEGDERAIYKMKKLETEIVLSQIRAFNLKGIASYIGAFWEMVSFKHFLSFVFFLLKKIILRIIKKVNPFKRCT